MLYLWGLVVGCVNVYLMAMATAPLICASDPRPSHAPQPQQQVWSPLLAPDPKRSTPSELLAGLRGLGHRSPSATGPAPPPKWAVLMLRSGRFAGAVFEVDLGWGWMGCVLREGRKEGGCGSCCFPY